MKKKIGFWRWWFKETLLWWILFIGISILTIFMILGFVVDRWFMLIPFGTLCIIGFLFLLVSYIIPWWKSVKKYFSDRKAEYKNLVEEG